MPGQLYKAAAIVGAAEANEIGFLETPVTALQLHIEAIKNLSDQTGVPISKIDGVFSTGWSTELCEHLGIKPKYIDTTAVGGCSFEMHVHHALAAIHAGIIDVALVSHGENGHSHARSAAAAPATTAAARRASPAAEMTMAYGLGGAPSDYAHAMVRHMHRYGTTREDFAHIREGHARLGNPQSSGRDVLEGETPLRRPDHGRAGRGVTADRLAADDSALLHGDRPRRRGARDEPEGRGGVEDDTRVDSRRRREHGPRQHARDGRLHRDLGIPLGGSRLHHGRHGSADMEMALIYDSFTITAAITAEMLGLAPRGEGHTLWKDGHAAPGASFPINTNGGGLSFNHSGMYGMPLLVEAYRQLSGTAEDGIHGDKGKQTDARTCVVNGTGGSLSTTGTLVLMAD